MIDVSIIIPAYNVEKYIRECLESALNQKSENFEIIVVNDGSTDNTLSIVNKMCEKYKNIKVITQKNKGLSGARNTGIKYAKGKYIYFLDSDDYIHENLINTCFFAAEKENLELITFDAKAFWDKDFQGDKSRYNFNYKRNSILNEETINGREFFKNNKQGYRSSVCLLFIKKEILEKNEILFHEGIVHEDELFTPLLLIKVKRMKYISKEYFFRRIRENSIMTKEKSTKNIIGYITVVENLKKNNIDNIFDDKINQLLLSCLILLNDFNKEKELRKRINMMINDENIYLKVRLARRFPIIIKIKNWLGKLRG